MSLIPGISSASTWTVKQGTQLNSVRQAIGMAHSGDTVMVYPGTYFEKNILIKKPLVLRGINKPVLDGEKKYEIISVWASHVTVEGFVLRNCGKSA